MTFCKEYTLANDTEKAKLDEVVGKCVAKIREKGEMSDKDFDEAVYILLLIHVLLYFRELPLIPTQGLHLLTAPATGIDLCITGDGPRF